MGRGESRRWRARTAAHGQKSRGPRRRSAICRFRVSLAKARAQEEIGAHGELEVGIRRDHEGMVTAQGSAERLGSDDDATVSSCMRKGARGEAYKIPAAFLPSHAAQERGCGGRRAATMEINAAVALLGFWQRGELKRGRLGVLWLRVGVRRGSGLPFMRPSCVGHTPTTWGEGLIGRSPNRARQEVGESG